ncbi:MAG: hypothetical protein JWL90_147 [Chthoniobacteraceae bacterium]|nr:hypothetical protein [Chthoniobacteraceae bacterium]
MKNSNLIKLCVAWMVVCIPLGWGVYKSVEKSMPLFKGQASPPAAASGR